MSKEDLIVFSRQRGHHQTKHNEERSNDNEAFEIAPVEYWANNHADEEEKKPLDSADPRDGRGRIVGKKNIFIVALEHPKCVDDAPRSNLLDGFHKIRKTMFVTNLPRVKKHKKSTCNLKPGDSSSVRWRRRGVGLFRYLFLSIRYFGFTHRFC